MSEDISEIMQKVNNMIQNNQIPDDIKNMLENFSSNNSSSNSSNNSSNNSSKDSSDKNYVNNKKQVNNDISEGSSSEIPNFDIDTLLKMKSIMEKINQNQSDPRSNLLQSLKPYLRNSRKNKVDEYIKIFRMEKVFEMMKPLGGEKKNDV